MRDIWSNNGNGPLADSPWTLSPSECVMGPTGICKVTELWRPSSNPSTSTCLSTGRLAVISLDLAVNVPLVGGDDTLNPESPATDNPPPRPAYSEPGIISPGADTCRPTG